MRCPHCHQENFDGAEKCVNCGRPLAEVPQEDLLSAAKPKKESAEKESSATSSGVSKRTLVVAALAAVLILAVIIVAFTALSGGGGGGVGGGGSVGTTQTAGGSQEASGVANNDPQLMPATKAEEEQIRKVADPIISADYPICKNIQPIIRVSKDGSKKTIYASYQAQPVDAGSGAVIKRIVVISVDQDGNVSVASSN